MCLGSWDRCCLSAPQRRFASVGRVLSGLGPGYVLAGHFLSLHFIQLSLCITMRLSFLHISQYLDDVYYHSHYSLCFRVLDIDIS